MATDCEADAHRWVEEQAAWLEPKRIQWCDGSDEERRSLTELLEQTGNFIPLNHRLYPNCWLYRSDPRDVARTEKSTFIVVPERDDAGPTNNWMSPDEAHERVWPLFRRAMRGRTMYVVPYLMGPPGSLFCRVGIQLTDSPYVVLNMRIMTRMGRVALEELARQKRFVPGVHALGTLDPEHRYILHFPRTETIWSINSGYGGNALLGKKCFGLRIASWIGRCEGWLAEHMLIVGIEDPSGRTRYIAAAFPSACGKTNLAMLVPPKQFDGYRVWTVGDDIAWLRIGPDGRLWAVNPEAGFFGVLKGTNARTNPNAVATFQADSIFTNAGLTPEKTPWWEGLTDSPPPGTVDWQGRPWRPELGPVAHPNARFTAPAARCPSISPHWEDPQGVPISAILFGGRRKTLVPLVYQAFDWAHGVFLGATMASETTAAQSGAVGVVRRDPMAMLPFCGYNMADYFAHWLEIGKRLRHPPLIFGVNWFRVDEQGRFLWPGFGENLRVLLWVLDRCEGRVGADETPIGYVPHEHDMNLEGLSLEPGAMTKLLAVDRAGWRQETEAIAEYFEQFGDRLPTALRSELVQLQKRLG